MYKKGLQGLELMVKQLILDQHTLYSCYKYWILFLLVINFFIRNIC